MSDPLHSFLFNVSVMFGSHTSMFFIGYGVTVPHTLDPIHEDPVGSQVLEQLLVEPHHSPVHTILAPSVD